MAVSFFSFGKLQKEIGHEHLVSKQDSKADLIKDKQLPLLHSSFLSNRPHSSTDFHGFFMYFTLSFIA